MVSESKIDDLLWREGQNAIKDPLDWETRKQINMLYNDARQAELEIELLKSDIKVVEYEVKISVGLAISAMLLVLLGLF